MISMQVQITLTGRILKEDFVRPKIKYIPVRLRVCDKCGYSVCRCIDRLIKNDLEL